MAISSLTYIKPCPVGSNNLTCAGAGVSRLALRPVRNIRTTSCCINLQRIASLPIARFQVIGSNMMRTLFVVFNIAIQLTSM